MFSEFIQNPVHLMSFLVLFPFFSAMLLAWMKGSFWQSWIVRWSSLLLMLTSLLLAFQTSWRPHLFFILPHLHWITTLGDLIITLFLFWIFLKKGTRKELWILSLLIFQTIILLYTDWVLGLKTTPFPFYLDSFSIIMILIIGVIGGLICIYAIPYMKTYHNHHPHLPDHRRRFFFLFFLFLSAMTGIVISNDLSWLLLFWEITTLCCFLLIGYADDAEARKNAFLALGYNLIGSLGIVITLWILAEMHQKPSLTHIISLGKLGAILGLLAAALLALAGLAKSAQLPFSSWLTGAMVAPTPVSALLHSSTMVNAGVFLILKLAPIFHAHIALGESLSFIGGITFLISSIIALNQSNIKRMLAYSTISNLGLIVACAGIGTPEAIWAAIFLIIFHAIAKALLFQTVGTVEHQIGSRDIETMDGLWIRHRGLTLALILGTLGMFLVPFGMLISKWACLQTFIHSSPILALLLVFGSAPTLFFWSKWMGKLISPPSTPSEITLDSSLVSKDTWFSIGMLMILTLVACFLFPAISHFWVDPYLGLTMSSLGPWTLHHPLFLWVTLILLLILPAGFFFLAPSYKTVTPYLCGLNIPATTSNAQFQGSLGQIHTVQIRNYYLTSYFKEKSLLKIGQVLGIIFLLIMILINFHHWKLSTPFLPPPVWNSNSPSWLHLGMVALLFFISAPILGALLTGFDRIVTARIQNRYGPPLLQPFYDILKLWNKQTSVVNPMQIFYVWGFVLFMLLTGFIFFSGESLLLVIFSMMLGSLFLTLAAFSTPSPYSHLGAERELIQMMAYEPLLLLTALGMDLSTGSFQIQTIATSHYPLLYQLPGFFLGFLMLLTIKLRKSPFDLSTSHHGHQELVKGLTTEFSGSLLALIEIGHWYENIILLGILCLFILHWPWEILLTVLTFLFIFEILIDNTYARFTWEKTLQTAWIVAALFGGSNLLFLFYYHSINVRP